MHLDYSMSRDNPHLIALAIYKYFVLNLIGEPLYRLYLSPIEQLDLGLVRRVSHCPDIQYHRPPSHQVQL